MRKSPEIRRGEILPTHDAHGSGWNESEPELYLDCTDPGALAPSLTRKTTTDDARGQSFSQCSVRVSISSKYSVHVNQFKVSHAQPWIEPFCPLASSTKAWQAHPPTIKDTITATDTAPSRRFWMLVTAGLFCWPLSRQSVFTPTGCTYAASVYDRQNCTFVDVGLFVASGVENVLQSSPGPRFLRVLV